MLLIARRICDARKRISKKIQNGFWLKYPNVLQDRLQYELETLSLRIRLILTRSLLSNTFKRINLSFIRLKRVGSVELHAYALKNDTSELAVISAAIPEYHGNACLLFKTFGMFLWSIKQEIPFSHWLSSFNGPKKSRASNVSQTPSVSPNDETPSRYYSSLTDAESKDDSREKRASEWTRQIKNGVVVRESTRWDWPTIKHTNRVERHSPIHSLALSVPFDKSLIKFAFNNERNAALDDKKRDGGEEANTRKREKEGAVATVPLERNNIVRMKMLIALWANGFSTMALSFLQRNDDSPILRR